MFNNFKQTIIVIFIISFVMTLGDYFFNKVSYTIKKQECYPGLVCDKKIEKEYIENKSKEFCKKRIFNSEETKEYCYLLAAKASKDETICQEIKSHYVHGSGNARYACYEEIASIKNDIQICNNVGTENLGMGQTKNRCIARVLGQQKDDSQCDMISSLDDRNQCYYHIALLTNNIDICKKITRHELGSPIVYNCYEGIAGNTGNINICNLAPGHVLSGCMYRGLEYIKDKKDVSLCGKIEDMKYAKKCYNALINDDNVESLCDLALTENAKTMCRYISDIFKLCRQANDKPKCYMDMGIKNNDLLMCDNALVSEIEREYKLNCYIIVAKNTNNKSICDDMEVAGKDRCYNQFL